MDNNLLIQIFSDIHIELWNKMPTIEAKAKYLFLAGDICVITNPLFFQFLDYCSLKWCKIFYVPGNHEYYIKKKNYNELKFEYMYKIHERYKNVYFLDNNFVYLEEENINIYGATFWTEPPFASTNEAQIYVNDYNNISYFKKGIDQVINLDINYVKNLSNDSINSLTEYLTNTDKKTIVMTHFPPVRSHTSNPKYLRYDRVLNSYFAWPDDILQKFKLDNILVWISGHTHWSYDFTRNNIRFISNQIGYRNEVGHTGLKEDGLYEIIIS